MVNFDARNDEIDSPLLTLLYLSRLQKEREAFEVIVDDGKLVYRHSGELSKWIFVLSTSRNMYVAEKKKGKFQHSSFLARCFMVCFIPISHGH